MKTVSRFLACSFLCQLFAITGVNAALAPDAVLMFDSSIYGTGTEAGMVVGGTFFSFDMDGNGDIELWERTGMTPYNGIQLGTAQPASGSHSGLPDGTESPSIDTPWAFFANTGMHYSNMPVNVISASGNVAYLDMSGWGITWNDISLPFGSGAWGSNPEGQAVVTCDVDCAIGDRFALYYTATIPDGDPSGIGGLRYRLGLDGDPQNTNQSLGFAQTASFNDSDPGMVLTGTIAPAAVPLPLPIWLFMSGLLGLICTAYRKVT